MDYKSKNQEYKDVDGLDEDFSCTIISYGPDSSKSLSISTPFPKSNTKTKDH